MISHMTLSWRFLEYNGFWNRITTELWMIEKLNQDFGLLDLGLDLIDPSRARRTSQQMLTHMTKDAFKEFETWDSSYQKRGQVDSFMKHVTYKHDRLVICEDHGHRGHRARQVAPHH